MRQIKKPIQKKICFKLVKRGREGERNKKKQKTK